MKLYESGYPPYDDETGWVPGGPGPEQCFAIIGSLTAYKKKSDPKKSTVIIWCRQEPAHGR